MPQSFVEHQHGAIAEGSSKAGLIWRDPRAALARSPFQVAVCQVEREDPVLDQSSHCVIVTSNGSARLGLFGVQLKRQHVD